MHPRLVWYEDNPPPGPPLKYENMVEEMQMLNLKIQEFNTLDGAGNVLHMNLLGARRYKQWYEATHTGRLYTTAWDSGGKVRGGLTRVSFG